MKGLACYGGQAYRRPSRAYRKRIHKRSGGNKRQKCAPFKEEDQWHSGKLNQKTDIPCVLILSYQFSILQICNYKKISPWYDDKCLLPKNRGEGGGIKLTYQSPLLDLVKVYALGTTFLQICIYKYMSLHVRIEALPT